MTEKAYYVEVVVGTSYRLLVEAPTPSAAAEYAQNWEPHSLTGSKGVRGVEVVEDTDRVVTVL